MVRREPQAQELIDASCNFTVFSRKHKKTQEPLRALWRARQHDECRNMTSAVVPVDNDDPLGRGTLALEDLGPATAGAAPVQANAASPSRRAQMMKRVEAKKAAAKEQMDLFAQLAEKRKADLVAKKARAKAALKVKKMELKEQAKKRKAELKVKRAELKKLAAAKRARLRQLKEEAKAELVKVRAMEPAERKAYLAERKARAAALAAKRKAAARAALEQLKAEKRARYCFDPGRPEPRRVRVPPTAQTVKDRVWQTLEGPETWFHACQWGDRELMKEMIEATAMGGGADIDDVDSQGMSGLLHAAANASTRNRERSVELLLSMRANVNLVSHPAKNTALMLAAKHGYERVVMTLMANGADPLLRDRDGKTAADLARMRRHVKCVYAIEEAILAPSLLGSAAYAARRAMYKVRYMAEKAHFKLLMLVT